MILRSFHLPAGMDSELRMLATHTNESKATLVRKMIAAGLEQAWTELENNKNQLSINEVEVDHKKASKRAKEAMQRLYATSD